MKNRIEAGLPAAKMLGLDRGEPLAWIPSPGDRVVLVEIHETGCQSSTGMPCTCRPYFTLEAAGKMNTPSVGRSPAAVERDE